jgi:hypothetical protein
MPRLIPWRSGKLAGNHFLSESYNFAKPSLGVANKRNNKPAKS